MMTFLSERVELLVRKGENGGFRHFLLFPQGFLKAISSRLLKLGSCGTELITITRTIIRH